MDLLKKKTKIKIVKIVGEEKAKLKSKNTNMGEVVATLAGALLEGLKILKAEKIPLDLFVDAFTNNLESLKDKKTETNYDRIHNMNKEELAEYLCNNLDCAFCPIGINNPLEQETYCTAKPGEEEKTLLEWLESEVQ